MGGQQPSIYGGSASPFAASDEGELNPQEALNESLRQLTRPLMGKKCMSVTMTGPL